MFVDIAQLLLFEEVEVATIAAVAKRFRARKTHFAQSAVGHVVDVAKQSAQLGAIELTHKYSIPMLCPIVNSKQSFRSPNNTFYGSLRRQQQSSNQGQRQIIAVLTHTCIKKNATDKVAFSLLVW